jgi:surface antigen
MLRAGLWVAVAGISACSTVPEAPAPVVRPANPKAIVEPPRLPPIAGGGLAVVRPRDPVPERRSSIFGPRGKTLSQPDEQLVLRPRVTNPTAGLQCVPYARNRSGIQIRGDAVTWWRQAQGRYATTNLPEVGAVLAVKGYRDPTRGHVAFVTKILGPRMIVVDHANWLNAEEITVDVPVADVSPGGDWSQIRIWHVPGGHWGGRIYTAEGFILPRAPGAATPGGPVTMASDDRRKSARRP